jgi:hypothetical protein
VKRAVLAVLFVLTLRPSPFGAQTGQEPAPAETATAFVERFQALLRSGDREAYLRAFEPGLREAEAARISLFWDELKMSSVTLRTAGVRTPASGPARLFVQAFFESAHAAAIESWTISLVRRGAFWSVASLDVPGNLTRLYKVGISEDRVQRARRVEVRHADIEIVMENAAVFFDNLPDIETALVVVGRGRVVFSPSDANERHQLELRYKKDRLDDEIDALFVRGSPGYLASNVRIEPAAGPASVSSRERSKAEAFFARNYPRSFTIESSLDGSLLSFLPRSEEAVLAFKARKAGELAYVFSPFAADEVSLYDNARDQVVSLYSPDRGDGQPLKRMFISFAEKFDVSSYALDLGYSPASSTLSARAQIEIVPLVDRLDNLKFRFNPDLEILRITDAEGRELFYTQDRLRKLLYVYFVAPVPLEEPASIQVFYRGRMRPVSPTTDVISQAGPGERILFQPRYETYFFSHAGYWYPGPAEEDYFLARLTLLVPPEYSCVANGELVSVGRREGLDDVVAIEKAGSAVYAFATRAPVKYMSFIVGKFGRPRERQAAVPIAAQVSTEIFNSRPSLVDQAADILDFFARSFGPYPYEKLDVVLRQWPDFGGHSPASFVVLNEVPWLGESGFRLPGDTPVDLSSWDEYFLAHEIAHQWWGQGVSFDSYKDQWLSEGLAQFAAASYLRHKYGPGAFASILKKFSRWTIKKSSCGPISMGSRLSYNDFSAYQAIVYDKAALVLFMLEDLLGRDTFEAGLQAYFEQNKFRAARTGDFIKAMESTAGRDLSGFFRGWLASWELPEVRTTWTETPVADGVRVDFRLYQTKGLFVFPLWIEWTAGETTGRVMIVVDEALEEASLMLPRRPSRIRVNPDRAVPGEIR